MIYSKYIVSEEFDVLRNCKQTEEFYILIHTTFWQYILVM